MTKPATGCMALPTVRTGPFDPPNELGRVRERQPVCRMIYPDGHAGWLVTAHSLVRVILADPRFSARGDLKRAPMPLPRRQRAVPIIPPGMFIEMDPPEHTRYRRLLRRQFSASRIDRLTPRIEQVTEELLSAMRRHGSPADLMTSFAQPMPLVVICELLGVPYADRDAFHRHTMVLFDLSSTDDQVLAALSAISDFLRDVVARKRVEPADDLLTWLVGAGELTDDELVGAALLLLTSGYETTANMLALSVFLLLSDRDTMAALHHRPALVPGLVEELLRYLTIVQFGVVRVALADVELGGVVIKAGESVTLSLAAANRDPDQFGRPDRFDAGRAVNRHVAFGHGAHKCVGAQLARVELRVGLAALLRRFPELRLAVQPEQISLRTDMSIYGVHGLPVTWH